MARETKLAIIFTSTGVLIGIFLSSLVFFCLRWYKKRSDFRSHRTSNLPIRKNDNGHALGLDSSASQSESVVVPLPDLPTKNLSPLWLNHHHKSHTTSVSGTPKYSYKQVLCGLYYCIILLFYFMLLVMEYYFTHYYLRQIKSARLPHQMHLKDPLW